MQVKKEELRETIIEVAKVEFVNKGYVNALRRKTAQKAHTTLENIYTYFISKEEILFIILDSVISQLDIFVEKHLKEEVAITSIREMEAALKAIDVKVIFNI